MEVALRLLQTLADPSAELQLAEKLHGAGRPDLQATLHNTIFKVLFNSAEAHTAYPGIEILRA